MVEKTLTAALCPLALHRRCWRLSFYELDVLNGGGGDDAHSLSFVVKTKGKQAVMQHRTCPSLAARLSRQRQQSLEAVLSRSGRSGNRSFDAPVTLPLGLRIPFASYHAGEKQGNCKLIYA